jgi:uncharacterized membrane protein
MDFSIPLAMRLLILLPIAFLGLLLPLFGQTRRGILFGVTVPIDFVHSHIALTALRRYRLNILALVVTIFCVAVLVLWTLPTTDSIAVALVATLAVLAEILGAFLLWHRQARIIKPHAAIVPLERHADLTSSPATVPILATALSLLPLAAAALCLYLHWSQIPARWPRHWSASGVANGWGTRSIGGVFGPLIAGSAIVVLFILVSIFTVRASGPQTAQRRRALVPLAVIAWLLAGIFCVIDLLPLTHLASSRFMLIAALCLIAVFAVALWLLRRSDLTLKATSVVPYDGTPDAKWHDGLIYYNPSDASVLLPKRFGLGWTLNFARPASWIYLGGILLFILFFITLTMLLK